MTRAWNFASVLLIGVLLVLSSGCSGCSADPFARLIHAQGEVTRDFQAAQNQWVPAALGAEFEIGDALHTGETSEARVQFDDGATLNLEAVTTVRFLAVAPDSGELGIDVETGEAVLQTDGATRLRTGIGLAVIESGSVLRLTRSVRGMKFVVSVGLARFETNGEVTELGPGEGVEVGIGMAILDRIAPEPSAAPPPSASAEAPDPELDGAITATIKGSGALIQPPGSSAWQPLNEGDSEIQPGSRVRLTAKNEAVISRREQTATLAGEGTFLVGGQSDNFVTPEAGSTELNADGQDVSLVVPGGTITALGSEGPAKGLVVVKKGNRVNLKVNRGRFRARVNGKEALLEAGEALESDSKTFSILGRSLSFSDIQTEAGGGLMIHDPAPPTAVGIRFKALCDHRGVVELLRNKRVSRTAVGENEASIHFQKGTHQYQVRCLSRDGELSPEAAKGRIIVFADAGTAALAKHPPTTSVNVDGRGYTVLYQNRLPAISVRWPNAPASDSYALRVRSPNGTRKLSSKTPARSFRSGSLQEGHHRLTFTASNGRTSRTSTISIRFDNAAPKGSIRLPSDGSFGPGESVRVSGFSLPGWKVSVGSTSFPMDAQRRFSGQVTAGPRTVILKFEHETRGVHHYLRRASGIPR